MRTLRELGALAFASRLRRLSDRLKAEATKTYHFHGIEFNDNWFLVALALAENDEATTSEIAKQFQVSHSAISQMVSAMKRRGLVAGHRSESDRRQTILKLTKKGHRHVEKMRPIWQAIVECTENLLETTCSELLPAIGRLEDELDRRSLQERVSARLGEAKE